MAALRPPAPQDAEAVLAVMVARDIADIGVPDVELADVHADWASPEVELGRDAWVAEGLYESAGMQPVWQAERWEKPLGLR